MIVAPPEVLNLDRIPTPIGTALAVSDETGVLRAFNWAEWGSQMETWLDRHYPGARRAEGRGPLRQSFEAYFQGEIDALTGIPWLGAGTDFQRQVWTALCAVKAGETVSYAALAERIGRPTAVRAVGLANGANPVAVVVPCHRVIGSNGALTGYAGGLERKRWLLEHERAAGAHRSAA